MVKIGIVGAESTHSLVIARALNVDKAVPGAAVEALWGESPALARQVALKGRVPLIVRRPEDLIGLVDAAAIVHRHAKRHLPAALPLLRAGMPLFIDKPFCSGVAEGRRFLAEAARRRVPVVSFSVMPLQKSFGRFRRGLRRLGRLESLASSGPADLRSPYAGLAFYGVHQAEMLVRLVGSDAVSARLSPSGSGGTGTVWFRGGVTAVMTFAGMESPAFRLTAVCEKGTLSQEIARDPDLMLTGIRSFVAMFRGRPPLYGSREILAPIAILEALEKSARTGRKERVAKL